MLQKWSSKFHSKGQNSIWTPINCHVRFVTLDSARQFRPKFFLQWKDCFSFQNICFQQTLRWYRIDLVTSPVFVRILLDPYDLPLRFVTLDNGRKTSPNLFFTGSVTFHFKKLCFQQHLRCYRNVLATSTVTVKMPCELR